MATTTPGGTADGAPRATSVRKRLGRVRQRARAARAGLQWGWRGGIDFVPPGHYYSPLPSEDEVEKDKGRIWGQIPRELPNIDLNEQGQLAVLAQIAGYRAEMPAWDKQGNAQLRYTFANTWFPRSDAIFLYGMLRLLRPLRVIEAGSGYSTCVMLDTNEQFLDKSVAFTCIEPNPERLLSVLRPEDKDHLTLHRNRVQDVDLAVFDALQAGDVLFIDTSHVSKVGSDVNHFLFNVLPRLASGVYIHIHDVFYPFEYLREWIDDGRAYTEDYLLRAFLMHNDAYEMTVWNSYLAACHGPTVAESCPLTQAQMDAGSSIWLLKR